MILTDAGPLVALYDRADEDHDACRRVAQQVQGPMISTWPVFTEVMHLLRGRGGRRAQSALWRLWHDGKLDLVDLDRTTTLRAADLMEKYADVPMDLADATLVAVAEARGLNRIFTLDADFHVYRLKGRRAFEIVPA